jgi:hypothetical protein
MEDNLVPSHLVQVVRLSQSHPAVYRQASRWPSSLRPGIATFGNMSAMAAVHVVSRMVALTRERGRGKLSYRFLRGH